MGLDQYGATLRTRAERRTPARQHSSWPLENDDFYWRLRLTGMVAPMVLDGPINGVWFQAYVDQVLVPDALARRHRDHGQSRHPQRRRRSRRHRSSGRKALYLPPYSPDFNPIENAFSKLKALLRKAAERTVDGLWIRIGALLPAFTPHLSHCV